jgi:hypothetical protein
MHWANFFILHDAMQLNSIHHIYKYNQMHLAIRSLATLVEQLTLLYL